MIYFFLQYWKLALGEKKKKVKFNYFSEKFLTDPKKKPNNQKNPQFHNSVFQIYLYLWENSNTSLFCILHKDKLIRHWPNTQNNFFSVQEKTAKDTLFLYELEFTDLISDTKILFKVSQCQVAIIFNSTFFAFFISKNLIRFSFIRTSNRKRFFTSQSHHDGIKRIL